MMDILLNSDNDLSFSDGDLAVGNSTLQEVEIILELNQGELKSFPILGASLIQLLKSKEKHALMEERVRVHLALDGKDYHTMKEFIRQKSIIK